MFRAFVPYMIIIVVLGVCSLHAVTLQLDKVTNAITWPGLHVLNAKGKPPASEIYKLNWLTAAGSQLFVCGLLTAAALRVGPRRALAIYAATLQAADLGDRHRLLGARAGLRDEPRRDDDHAGHVGRGGRRVLRLPVAADRLVRSQVDANVVPRVRRAVAPAPRGARRRRGTRPSCSAMKTRPIAFTTSAPL